MTFEDHRAGIVARLKTISEQYSLLLQQWQALQTDAHFHDLWGAQMAVEQDIMWAEWRSFGNPLGDLQESLTTEAITHATRRLGLAEIAYKLKGLDDASFHLSPKQRSDCGRVTSVFSSQDCPPPAYWHGLTQRLPTRLRHWWLLDGAASHLQKFLQGNEDGDPSYSAHGAEVAVPQDVEEIPLNNRYTLIQLKNNTTLRYRVTGEELQQWAQRRGLQPLTVGEIYQAARWLKNQLRIEKYWTVFAPSLDGTWLEVVRTCRGASLGSTAPYWVVRAVEKQHVDCRLLDGEEFFLYQQS